MRTATRTSAHRTKKPAAPKKNIFRSRGVDREPLSTEDLAAIRRGMEEIRRGNSVSLEDYERRRKR